MHELSIAYSVVEIATESARAARAVRVKEVYVRLGALSGVVRGALEFSYEIACFGLYWTVLICISLCWCVFLSRAYGNREYTNVKVHPWSFWGKAKCSSYLSGTLSNLGSTALCFLMPNCMPGGSLLSGHSAAHVKVIA